MTSFCDVRVAFCPIVRWWCITSICVHCAVAIEHRHRRFVNHCVSANDRTPSAMCRHSKVKMNRFWSIFPMQSIPMMFHFVGAINQMWLRWHTRLWHCVLKWAGINFNWPAARKDLNAKQKKKTQKRYWVRRESNRWQTTWRKWSGVREECRGCWTLYRTLDFNEIISFDSIKCKWHKQLAWIVGLDWQCARKH